ncbi:MAG: 3-deoxy-7-phosphoheptulonate synthase [Deltaproteobacteria bacterium]|nr:3-deoxy-7-phosphoheptulonate synthase [Deltaproteobacteria bacterium]
MLIALKRDANPETVEATLRGRGLWTRRLEGSAGAPALSIEQGSAGISATDLAGIEGVAEVFTAPSAHPRVDAQAGSRPFDAGPVLLAGPCAVEDEAQIHQAARCAARAGARYLRGGAFKPRSSPYAFSGRGELALSWLADAARENNLLVVTEAMSEAQVERVAKVADLLQVGSRNMANFALLHAMGRTKKPVLLKRGMSATIEEWLLAGEHLMNAGAKSVIFCERGVTGFDAHTRNLLDLGAVALLKHHYHLPVIVDPSHAVGRRDLIPPLAHAAMAAGADGLLVEMHPKPARALSDGPQALTPEQLTHLAQEMGLLATEAAP